MPTITVNVNDELKLRMEDHPEINWSEVTRQAIEDKNNKLDVMDELTADSTLTNEDVEEISVKINQSACESLEDESR